MRKTMVNRVLNPANPRFEKARPVWLKGLAECCNVQAVFTGNFEWDGCGRVIGTITAATLYRMTVNGRFAGYGPARAPHGYMRADSVDVTGYLTEGTNEIRIDVAGYYCCSFYSICNPSFLQAEFSNEDRVLVATGWNMTGYEDKRRARKVFRYAHQRTFSEVWDWAQETEKMDTEVTEPELKLLPRRLRYPEFTVKEGFPVWKKGSFSINSNKKLCVDRYIKNVGPDYSGYPENEVEYRGFYTWQQMEQEYLPSWKEEKGETEEAVKRQEFLLYDLKKNQVGMIGLKYRAREDSHILICFDEKLKDGFLRFEGLEMTNTVEYFAKAGQCLETETFEAYGMRFIGIYVLEGAISVEQMYIREYAYPFRYTADHVEDEELDKILQAAKETLRFNAVDTYTDCPTRERAGWLCDSYYSAQAEYALTGDNEVEKVFMENYLLYPGVETLPAGMLPMCYPAEHQNGEFIPQWAMWYILELQQFVKRSTETDAESYRGLCYRLIRYFENYENEDGLLECLPGWNFVDWSKANELVWDVNYPTNMLYSNMLRIIAGLYSDEKLFEKSDRIKNTVIQKSFDGQVFADHAVRGKDKVLVNGPELSEVAQYYAVLFLDLDLDREPYGYLKELILEKFNMNADTGKFPYSRFIPAQALMGIYLRMELLERLGEKEKLLDEIKRYFGKMAEYSGTFWEHREPKHSMNHGFASYVGKVIWELK